MKEIKKGIEPKKEDNTQTHTHDSKVSKICLLLFLLFLLLICLGEYTGNEALKILGFGIGASVGLMQLTINLEGEDE